MANMIQFAKEQTARVIQAAYEAAAAEGALPAGVPLKGTIEIPKDPRNGDYAASAAMAAAKVMQRKPRDIAQALTDHMDADENTNIWGWGSFFVVGAVPGLSPLGACNTPSVKTRNCFRHCRMLPGGALKCKSLGRV